MSAEYGYTRASVKDQNMARQLDAFVYFSLVKNHLVAVIEVVK